MTENEAWELFKKRRKKRLDASANGSGDDDGRWITTENGHRVHINEEGEPDKGNPYVIEKMQENGVAGVASVRKRRKQVEPDKSLLRSGGVVRDVYMEVYNSQGLFSIIQDTGYSKEEAIKFQDCLKDYFGGDFGDYVSGKRKKEVEIIDDGIRRLPSYDGEIYRGMHFKDFQKSEMEKFKNCDVGDEMSMRTFSSWSSRESVCDKFAKFDDWEMDSVLIVCKKNKSAAGVQHLSKFATSEAEVLAPSDARWVVTNKKVVGKYDYLKEENKDNPYMLENIENLRGYLEDKSVVILEVEEI